MNRANVISEIEGLIGHEWDRLDTLSDAELMVALANSRAYSRHRTDAAGSMTGVVRMDAASPRPAKKQARTDAVVTAMNVTHVDRAAENRARFDGEELRAQRAKPAAQRYMRDALCDGLPNEQRDIPATQRRNDYSDDEAEARVAMNERSRRAINDAPYRGARRK
jgi:hypothetical protein